MTQLTKEDLVQAVQRIQDTYQKLKKENELFRTTKVELEDRLYALRSKLGEYQEKVLAYHTLVNCVLADKTIELSLVSDVWIQFKLGENISE